MNNRNVQDQYLYVELAQEASSPELNNEVVATVSLSPALSLPKHDTLAKLTVDSLEHIQTPIHSGMIMLLGLPSQPSLITRVITTIHALHHLLIQCAAQGIAQAWRS